MDDLMELDRKVEIMFPEIHEKLELLGISMS